MFILVCFAVKEEAKPFQKLTGQQPGVRTVLTGMGQENAVNTIRTILAAEKPELVLTCGFAGGLNPKLKSGEVIFLTTDVTLTNVLTKAGAEHGDFFCANHVVSTAAEKGELWRSTGLSAVEMESLHIHQVCTENGVPSATVRVILDEAGEDLPLDFNALMTPDMRMDFGKLSWTIAKSPGKISALMRLQKQSQAAAEKLAQVLAKVIAK